MEEPMEIRMELFGRGRTNMNPPLVLCIDMFLWTILWSDRVSTVGESVSVDRSAKRYHSSILQQKCGVSQYVTRLNGPYNLVPIVLCLATPLTTIAVKISQIIIHL